MEVEKKEEATTDSIVEATKDEVSNETSQNVNDLDHAKRKVIVYNIDKYVKNKHLKRLTDSFIEGTSAKIVKMKKPPKNNWIVMTFETEEMVEKVITNVNDKQMKNKKGGLLRAAKANESSYQGKRGRDDDNSRASKRHRREPVECVKTDDEVRDKLTPFWKIESYEEQLETKTKMMVTQCFVKIINGMKKKFRTLEREMAKNPNGSDKKIPPLYKWLSGKNAISMSSTLGAPKRVEYRNKSELTIGYRHTHVLDENGKPIEIIDNDQQSEDNQEQTEKKFQIKKTPAAGFMGGGWAGGVSDPHCLSNIPDIVCGVADVLNKFLESSPIPPYDCKNHRGCWRTITIRNSERTKQCMVIIIHAPATGGAGRREDGSDDYSEHFESEKQRLISMLKEKIPTPKRTYPGYVPKNNEYIDYGVTSIFFQEFEGLSNPPPQHPVQHAFGNECIEEQLLQCKFQISPGAFFQVTTEGAENLYNVVVDRVKEVTPDPEKTLLFDVCCGTGTIGLTCMKEGAVGEVIGIDIAEPAIRDAKINAEKNGYGKDNDRTRFVASRAELVMQREASSVNPDRTMVAVVDPAREGLHPGVIKALRGQSELQRIVYVSCNPTGSLVNDAVILCSPATNKFKGLPFKITSAQPVDMFPLTDHCEMVMVFDRMSEAEAVGEESNSDSTDKVEETAESKEEATSKDANENTDE